MEAPVDQLKQFALDSQPERRPVVVLDVTAYLRAVREGLPIPLFAPPGGNGKPKLSHTRHLRAHQIAHVLASPLSPEFYEAAHGVQEIIVRDLRRRKAEGGCC